MYTSMEQSWKTQRDFGAAGENDADNIKRVFLEGDPVLLAVTSVVSLLHTVFDFLAFKNDVVFWKNRKSMEGLSGRSVVFNAACQLIIFLYLCDNETSWMILMSSGMGAAIEFWKVTKAMDVDIVRPTPTSLPRLRIKPKQSSLKSETARHDADAMRYMSSCCIRSAPSRRLQPSHARAQGLVLFRLELARWRGIHVRVHRHDASTVHQLQIEIGRRDAVETDGVQVSQHYHRRFVRLRHQDANPAQNFRLQRRRDLLLFLYQRRIYRIDASRVNEFGSPMSPLRTKANERGPRTNRPKQTRPRSRRKTVEEKTKYYSVAST